MSALKRPGIWDKKSSTVQGELEIPAPTQPITTEAENNDNQEKEITAKRLDVEDTESSGGQAVNLLDGEDILPQNIQDTGNPIDQDIKRLDVQDVIHLDSQNPGGLDDKTSRRQRGQSPKWQKAETQNSQTSQRLDAIPLNAKTPSQLEVEPQNAEPADLQVDKTPKLPSDEVTKPLDAGLQDDETPKRKKKAKSASLVKKTYYIDHDLDGAIELMAVLQKGDQSDIVRQLLRSAIPEYYLTQWKVMSDHSK